MNTINNPNNKNDPEDFDTEDQVESKSERMREENKNSPENFGSLRHQMGAVEDQPGDKDDENIEDSNEDSHLGEPEYRDPTPPSTTA